MKVSREGIVLIKSFEGFRPRAERLADGRWIIGYGHTRSARDGATVGEGDAELLLQYDLLPVVAAIQTALPIPLNQHQVDALASYALSVGVEPFVGSEVVRLMRAGQADQAATALAQSFQTAPDHSTPDPMTRRRAAERALFVHDPDQPVALASLLTAAASAPLVIPAGPAPEPQAETPPPTQTTRADAVAALLGETPSANENNVATEDEPQVESRPVVEATEAPGPETAPVGAVTIEIAATLDDSLPSATPSDVGPDLTLSPATPSPGQETEAWRSSVALTLQRYSPYAGRAFGPLPSLNQPSPAPSSDDPSAPEAREDAGLVTVDSRVDEGRLLILTPPPEVAVEPPAREVWSEEQRHPTPEHAEDEAALFGDDLTPEASLQVLRHEDVDAESPGRFDWSETGAFLGMGAVGLVAVGASIAGFNLAADQVAARAFNETTMAAWVLALIGALCVGVAAFNLYLRWGRKADD